MLTGWKAVKYFGCPSYFIPVIGKFKNKHPDTKNRIKICMYSTNDQFIWSERQKNITVLKYSKNVLTKNKEQIKTNSNNEVKYWKTMK